ncbi:MAG: flippase-like domain-containing protein [Lachnospiraceae bacterium]|nr:flippase-like domain-containing protein [Lachnospiraceae bacterium]
MIDKKKLIWIFISALLAILTVLAVLSQAGSMSIQDLKDALVHAHKGWLFLAVCAMLGFIVFEGEAIRSILRNINYKRSFGQGFVFAAADVYFSAITPSASGGQPASAFFMMKSKIPGATVTAVLIMNLVMYTLGIITVGLICIFTAPGIFLNFNILSRILILLGYIVLILLAVVFIMLLTRGEILRNIATKALRLLAKLKLIRNPEAKIEKLNHKMLDYKDCVEQMRGHKKALISAYLWNLAQRVSQICVSVFMYMALGGKMKHAYAIWVTQSMVAIGSNCVPIPGGMGVTDYLMVDGFKEIMEKAAAFQLELLSRSLSFYVCILVSAITVLVGYISIKRRERME